MNHIDFVLWVVGWAFLMGLQPKGMRWNTTMNMFTTIIWIAIAILLWKGAV